MYESNEYHPMTPSSLPGGKPQVTELPKPTVPSSMESPKKKSFFWSIVEVAVTLIGIFILAKILHATIFHPFYVVGDSMKSTYQDGDYLFVDKVSYRLRSPERGEVIVFAPPWITENQTVFEKQQDYGIMFPIVKTIEDGKGIINFFGQMVTGKKNLLSYENLGAKDYIKRIVGLPTETVEIRDDGFVYIYNKEHPEGLRLDEEYLDKNLQTRGSLRVTLRADEYFVLGDNRPNSSDSRGGISADGKAVTPHTVPRQYIEGRVGLRLLPLNKIAIMQAPDYNE
jgi:signal peptidase I